MGRDEETSVEKESLEDSQKFHGANRKYYRVEWLALRAMKKRY